MELRRRYFSVCRSISATTADARSKWRGANSRRVPGNNFFKRQKIESMAILLNAAIDAKTRVGLKMNVKKDSLDTILNLLPSEKSPTVSSLADSEYMAIEIIVEDKVERELIPQLKRAGASGIITYALNKVIH